MIPRRAILAAAPAAAFARPAAADELRVRGSRRYSESAMVMSVSADGASALTLRFCRFPEENQTWLWCHVFIDGRLYAHTDPDLPCGPERLADSPVATYRSARPAAELRRLGRGPALTDVSLSAALAFHQSTKAPHGRGRWDGRIEGSFTPRRALTSQVLAGRDEVYGTLSAEVEVAGKRVSHTGPAKFHEQRQESPRFEAPFNYAWLAGEGAMATTLLTARGASGGWIWDGVEDDLADMTADPPDEVRRTDWKLKSGRVLPGRLEALVRYEIPIFGRRWQGSFVRGEAAGRPIVGVSNDWLAEPDIYAAARARA